jgi:hypothetical protein
MPNNKSLIIEEGVQESNDNYMYTRYYNLEPEGVGTPYVESLTSYISRLAIEHNVSFINLIRDIKANNCYPCYLNYHINGVGRNTKKTVELLSKYTSRNDIINTTFLTLKGVMPGNRIIDIGRRFCPICFYDNMNSNKVIYEPLIWQLNCISICPIHNISLIDRCTYADCSESLSRIGRLSIPGYCPKCLRWLGNDQIRSDEVDQEFIKSQNWICREIELLLVEVIKKKCTVSKKRIHELIKQLMTNYQRNDNAIINNCVLVHLHNVKRYYSFNSIIIICYYLNLSLHHLILRGEIKTSTNERINIHRTSK